MFCEKCGSKLEEDSVFCPNCGAKYEAKEVTAEEVAQTPVVEEVVQTPVVEEVVQTPVENEVQAQVQQPVKKSNKKALVAVIIAIVVLIGGGVAAFFGFDALFDMFAKSIDSYEIADYIDEKDDIADDWEDLEQFDLVAKFELLKELGELKKEAAKTDKELEECAPVIEELLASKEQYDLSGGYKAYEELLNKCSKALENRDADTNALVEEANAALEELITANEEYVNSKLDEYADVDMSLASAAEMKIYNEGVDEAKDLLDAQKYNEIKTVFDKVDGVVFQYIEPENYLNVSVQQVDVSAYPYIKLYARLEAQNTGKVPDDLDETMFYIRKKDANANYVKQVVSRVSQLNEVESLNIDMVADISGSMSGAPLREAKTIMSSFVNSVQFHAGDKVELTTFSTGVYIEEEFTNDATTLVNKINGLETDDMTSLYDALYTAVTRVAAQSGAKCVIAFTDGADNYSNCSSEDVIALAKRYHVPIFIIGIGSSSDYNASNIAYQTGGKYYSVYDVNSMEDIYQEIYREQKELYLIEFVDDEVGNMTDSVEVTVGYNSNLYGGNCNFSYEPNILLRVDGSSFYKDGPEAVVEAYMNGFDDAMTQSDFSYISDYLKEGSNIYNTQMKYIQKSFAEVLDSYEIVDVTYNSNDECIVTTRETYYVLTNNAPLQLMTQQCQYIVVRENGEWKITDFAGSVEVLSRINQ